MCVCFFSYLIFFFNFILATTPRRQAEAFTIDLTDGGNSSAPGSVCVPERLRRNLEERQQMIRKHTIPQQERPITAPARKTVKVKI